MKVSRSSSPRASRLVAISEWPTQYHVPIFRCLFHELGERFEAIYASPGQTAGMRYERWGDREIRNDTGLLTGYPNRIVGPLNWRGTRQMLADELGLRRGDAVLFHTVLPRFSRAAILAAKSLGCRILFRGSSYQSPYRPRWRNEVGSVRDRVTFLLFDAFCATGTTTWRHFQKHAPGKPLVFAPYCTDEHVFSEVLGQYDQIRKQVRASYDIKDDQLMVAFLGSFIDVKNVKRLTEAMSRVDGLGIRLVLGGDGPLREQVVQYIEQRRWIDQPIYAGFLDRRAVSRMLCGSDALALASLHDPWGVVINEALYLNNLCLVSPVVGAAPDLIWEGKNGTYVDPEDVASIADGLRRLRAIHASGAFRETNARINQIFSAANAANGILRAFEPQRTGLLGPPPGLSGSIQGTMGSVPQPA